MLGLRRDDDHLILSGGPFRRFDIGVTAGAADSPHRYLDEVKLDLHIFLGRELRDRASRAFSASDRVPIARWRLVGVPPDVYGTW